MDRPVPEARAVLHERLCLARSDPLPGPRQRRAEAGALGLVDLGSRNGTLLNGSRIIELTVVRAGDRIVLGETSIDVSEESAPGPESSSTRRSDRPRQDDALHGGRPREPPRRGGRPSYRRRRAHAARDVPPDPERGLAGAPHGHPRSRTSRTSSWRRSSPTSSPTAASLCCATARGSSARGRPFRPGVDPSDIRLSRTLVQAVAEQQRGVLMIDTATDAKIATAESIRLRGSPPASPPPLFVGRQGHRPRLPRGPPRPEELHRRGPPASDLAREHRGDQDPEH